MLRSLLRALAWVLSVVVRVAFVVAVCGLAAGFAVGGFDLPANTTDLDEAVGGVLGDVAGVGVTNESGTASAPGMPSSNTAELNGTRLEYRIHSEVNEERRQHGRSNLSFDTDLRPVARYHSADMAKRNYFAHVGPEGETLTDRYRRFGYQCRVRTGPFQYATGGENILYTYYGAPVAMDNRMVRYETPEDLARGIVNGWMNSTGHRENLLRSCRV